MKVKEIMTQSPTFCTPETVLEDAARMMCDADCGEIPVLDSASGMKPVGVITDRDITCRAVAEGKSTTEGKVADFMTAPAITVTPDADVEECLELLEKNQIRRAPVVDERGRCCGIVSQADVARKVGPRKAGELVREISGV